MGRPRRYPDELRRHAVHEVVVAGRKVPQVARELGIASPETLRSWVRQASRDRGLRPGSTSAARAETVRLRKEVADQQRSIEILRAATAYFRDRRRPVATTTTEFVDLHRDRWPVAAMCKALGVSERSYYAAKRRPPSARSIADEEHRKQIRRVWESNDRLYGARRVWSQLRDEGYVVARCTVERLMAEMGIRGVGRGTRSSATREDRVPSRAVDLRAVSKPDVRRAGEAQPAARRVGAPP